MDFFIWHYLKNIVYKDTPQSIAELKKKIEDAIREIDTTMCQMVFLSLLKRASLCLANGVVILITFDFFFFFFFFFKTLAASPATYGGGAF